MEENLLFQEERNRMKSIKRCPFYKLELAGFHDVENENI